MCHFLLIRSSFENPLKINIDRHFDIYSFLLFFHFNMLARYLSNGSTLPKILKDHQIMSQWQRHFQAAPPPSPRRNSSNVFFFSRISLLFLHPNFLDNVPCFLFYCFWVFFFFASAFIPKMSSPLPYKKKLHKLSHSSKSAIVSILHFRNSLFSPCFLSLSLPVSLLVCLSICLSMPRPFKICL